MDKDILHEAALEAGQTLFAKECTFVIGCAGLEQLPENEKTEVAFAGRSNVGKSSLINALTNRRDLARASATPGRTQQINYFDLSDALYLVDLPGYGYAKAPEKEVKKWNNLVFTYLKGRPTLRRVFLLIDSRHGITKKDEEVMTMMDKAAVVFQVVMTKCDKPNKTELAKNRAAVETAIKKHTAAYPEVIVTSSQKNIGMDEVRAQIAELAGCQIGG